MDARRRPAGKTLAGFNTFFLFYRVFSVKNLFFFLESIFLKIIPSDVSKRHTLRFPRNPGPFGDLADLIFGCRGRWSQIGSAQTQLLPTHRLSPCLSTS